MSVVYPAQMSDLHSRSRQPVDLQRVQNDSIRDELTASRLKISQLEMALQDMTQLLKRRTQGFSPSLGFTHQEFFGSKGMYYRAQMSSLYVTYVFQLPPSHRHQATALHRD